MIEFQKKKKIRKFVYSPFTLLGLLILSVFMIQGVLGVYHKERISREKLEAARIELEKLEIRERGVAQSIEYLKTDEGVEGEIRRKFRAAKEGENIAVILDEGSASTTEEASSTHEESHGFWYNLFH